MSINNWTSRTQIMMSRVFYRPEIKNWFSSRQNRKELEVNLLVYKFMCYWLIYRILLAI